ncbi:MAG: hypothetical protein KBE53_08185 [Chromatiaceae bacterium]|nr:hypothetical protein [Chromatiaceae bacterium]
MHDHVKAKVEGFAIDLVNGTVDLGWPRCLWRDYPRASPRRDRLERLLMERKLKRGPRLRHHCQIAARSG